MNTGIFQLISLGIIFGIILTIMPWLVGLVIQFFIKTIIRR